MCLATIEEGVRKSKSGVGWKVFSKQTKDEYHYTSIYPAKKWVHKAGLYTGYHWTVKRPVGRWIKDTVKGTITSEDNRKYRTGFHIFLNKSDAEQYCGRDHVVRKVEWKEQVAFGQQATTFTDDKMGPCVVARCMKIVPTKSELNEKKTNKVS